MQFERVSSAKVLGVTIGNDLKWNDHVDTITSKAARRLYLLSQLKRAGISPDDLLAFYCSVIGSVLEFPCQLFHRSLPKYLSEDIERIQRRTMRIIFPSLSYCQAIDKAKIPALSERSESLRSTKWNANLILLRDYAELVALCKVIVWKTHIPVRTQK